MKRIHFFLFLALVGITFLSCKKDKYVDATEYHDKIVALANGDTTGPWHVKNQPLPLRGAILPKHRIIAYYGNLSSKRMGALGEYEPEDMWDRLNKELDAWEAADPSTPVVPALHYIAIVAQADAGNDSLYRNRMSDKQIEAVMDIADMGPKNTIVFLDLQVGLSTIQDELPEFEKYLKKRNVHLGIDPEFSMKDGTKPGKKIGTYDAEDINYCSEYLAKLVRKHKLPPKVLVIHRFTQGMVTNYKDIILRPEVQIVMHMDGWGAPKTKKASYRQFIYKEPVQFTGVKIFYKNDIKHKPNRLMTPEEILKLRPQPSYIQYQ